MPEMTAQELAAFLRRPLVASLTTLRPDGSSHTTPVWQQYDGSGFCCIMGDSSVKARNVRRDRRVSLCIATHEEPYAYVLVDGTAVLRSAGVEELAHTMSVRYVGAERGPAYAEKLLADRSMTVLVVTPTRMLTESDA